MKEVGNVAQAFVAGNGDVADRKNIQTHYSFSSSGANTTGETVLQVLTKSRSALAPATIAVIVFILLLIAICASPSPSTRHIQVVTSSSFT